MRSSLTPPASRSRPRTRSRLLDKRPVVVIGGLALDLAVRQLEDRDAPERHRVPSLAVRSLDQPFRDGTARDRVPRHDRLRDLGECVEVALRPVLQLRQSPRRSSRSGHPRRPRQGQRPPRPVRRLRTTRPPPRHLPRHHPERQPAAPSARRPTQRTRQRQTPPPAVPIRPRRDTPRPLVPGSPIPRFLLVATRRKTAAGPPPHMARSLSVQPGERASRGDRTVSRQQTPPRQARPPPARPLSQNRRPPPMPPGCPARRRWHRRHRR